MKIIYLLNLPHPYQNALKIGKTYNLQTRIDRLSKELVNVQANYTEYFSMEVTDGASVIEAELINYMKSRYKLFNADKKTDIFVHNDSEAMKADAKQRLLLLVENRQLSILPNSENEDLKPTDLNLKRKEVEKWLMDDELKLWSNSHIANQCGVSRTVVARVEVELRRKYEDYTRPSILRQIDRWGNETWKDYSSLIK